MSIQTYNTKILNENNEPRTEKQILMEYYNKLVNECRKETKDKTYEELDNGEPYNRFQNRLGYFEDKLNYTINEMNNEITYKKHKEILNRLENKSCLYEWEYTDNPLEDLNTYAKLLRTKLKKVISIYEQHSFRRATLIRGYNYYKK